MLSGHPVSEDLLVHLLVLENSLISSCSLGKYLPVFPAGLEILSHHSLQVEELQDRLKISRGFDTFFFPLFADSFQLLTGLVYLIRSIKPAEIHKENKANAMLSSSIVLEFLQSEF